MMVRVGVFSDLHILSEKDPFYCVFLNTLKKHFRRGDKVILAGDVFDLFVGEKLLFLDRYKEFFHLLDQLIQNGIAVSIIDGNHDFYFSKAHLDGQVEVQDSEIRFTIENKQFYIAHGDLVDSQDRSYLLLRAFLRSSLGRVMIRWAPDRWIDRLGQTASDYGKGSRLHLPQDWSPEERSRLREKFHGFAKSQMEKGADYVVMGHCHDFDEKMIQLDGRVGQYINMGFPKIHKKYLVWTSDCQRFVREDFDFQ